MRIMIYEHASGGGYAGNKLFSNVLAEGFAMLRCIVSDFRTLGHEVTVLLDERIYKYGAQTGANYQMQVLHAHEPEKFIKKAAETYDAFFIIAPETNKTLERLVKVVESTGKISLNSKSASISKVSDKTTLNETLDKNVISKPKTWKYDLEDKGRLNSAIDQGNLSLPLIFKPIDGTSCCGISKVERRSDVEIAMTKIKRESQADHFLVQEYIQGDAVSVSLISNGQNAVAFSLNKQYVTLASPKEESRYQGGCVPYEHSRNQEAFTLAKKAVELFPGLRGYVGVDMILGEKGIFVLDINARLTTSYVGLRQVADINLAEVLLKAINEEELPEKFEICGVACFEKTSIDLPNISTYRKATKMKGVISPPFYLEDSRQAMALIMGYGDDIESAMNILNEVRMNICGIAK